jgi:signal transduction histidine kinase
MPAVPLWVDVDSQRIRQVLRNLLGNALKFTPSGGRISVSLQVREAGFRIEVRDTGIGISSEHLPHVFAKFYQADSSNTREQGGVGLGLAISRAFVEAHGGRMGVESAPRQGSCFWFEIADCALTLHSEEGPVC